jgi:hypothetical protein
MISIRYKTIRQSIFRTFNIFASARENNDAEIDVQNISNLTKTKFWRKQPTPHYDDNSHFFFFSL